jgi:autotransporter-associated beta strand protein
LGQYTVGTFVAITTSQVITLAGNASTQINALQLRDLGVSPVVPAPVFTPSAGLYLGAQAVSISTAGKIFYTTNGSTPTASSAVYSGPITVPVNTTMTITAFATNTAQADSAVASATYSTFASPAVPTWIAAAGGSWANTANWSNGVVANASGVTADFSTLNLTSNASVTVDGAPTVGRLIFGDTTPDHNWTLSAGSGGPLTLVSSNIPAIAVNNQTTTINAVLAGTQGLNKTGAGYLTLGGANSYLGTATVLAGTLEAQAKSGDQPYVVTNGATLKIGYTTGGGYANTAMQIYGSGAAATTGLYLKGGTTYNVAGGVVVNYAPTTIRQYGSGLAGIGTFDINRTPGLSISAAASGSATDPNIQIVNAGYGMVITTAAGANTATGDLVINGPLHVTGQYGLLTEGNGSVRLNGVASPANAALNVIGGSVICGTANCVGTNAFLNVGAVNASGVTPSTSAIFDLNGTSQTVSNAALAGTLKMTINKGGTPKCNTLNCWGQPATFGGTLVVNNLGGALALGDTFTLFPTPAASGFDTLILPTVANGLAWQDNSAVDGTIKVITGSVPPSIVTDLSGSTDAAYVGGAFIYAITASGDPTLRYQWRLNGTTVVGSDSPTLTLTSLTLGSSGNYSCTVTNNYGVAQSQTNYLQVVKPNPYGAAVIATAPTAFWPLDEADGTTAFDVFDKYNATYSGGYFLDNSSNSVTGTQGVGFDGSTGKALTAYAPALNPAVFTAAAWVNPGGTPSSEYCVLSCGQFASPRSGWLIYQFPNNWDLRTYNGNGATVAAEAVGTSAPTLGAWEHLAVSWDGTTASLYVNGVLEGTNVPTATPKYYPGTSGGFCVGARADSSFYFPGTVSDAVFYNRVLIPQEIKALAKTGPFVSTNPTNLTASVSSGSLNLSWPLDHTGWRLLVQTNNLAAGISSNPNDWATVPGANSANQISIPIGAAQTGEFYRLVYP